MERANEVSAERLVYTVPEVAKLLGINVVTTYELTKRSDFPAIRINRRIIIPKAGLERWLDSQTRGALGCE